MAMRQLEVPVNFAPSPSIIASTAQSCQRKECRRRVPKSEMRKSGSLRSRSIFSQSRAVAWA